MTFFQKFIIGVVLALAMAILGVAFYQKHDAKMDVEGAKIDEDYAHFMAATSKDPAEKAHYKGKEEEAAKDVGDAKKRLAMRAKEADREAKEQLKKLKSAQGRMEKEAGLSDEDASGFDKEFQASKGEVK